eukprot:CAMPEP_0181196462 /NCGR_PEP_ID=MMETSP1096-20121128/15480_1 /TAXON_ID=156174 ORGANISM="Chrysochromulina ericina, Strain CCMP281" /NCGR_SAMPLE_ID=MMETSP1096 /ASSEMBLY_ACC=CAM_ASM_000453 /LENGTH=803 /DNA_ID=CAMNT_0023286227 /DNA_START=59 /DNA_END=2470 /DNA_ORIENTATION=-
MPKAPDPTEPTYWGELNPKTMNNKLLKLELELRKVEPKGNKTVLQQKLQKELDKEKAEEDRLAKIRKAEKKDIVIELVKKYDHLVKLEPYGGWATQTQKTSPAKGFTTKFTKLNMNVAEEQAIKSGATSGGSSPFDCFAKCLAFATPPADDTPVAPAAPSAPAETPAETAAPAAEAAPAAAAPAADPPAEGASAPTAAPPAEGASAPTAAPPAEGAAATEAPPAEKPKEPEKPKPAPAPEPAPPPEPPKPKGPEKERISIYDEPEALLMTVEKREVCVLKASWVLRQFDAMRTLVSRAELDELQRSPNPKDRPFWSSADLREKIRMLGPEFGWMLISYTCKPLSAEQPDPMGYHMRVLATALEVYMSDEGMRNSPLTRTWDQYGIGEMDCAIFIPWASISEPHTELGLDNTALWMGHRSTVFWRNTKTPKDFKGVPYYQDGWCAFESLLGQFVKKSGRMIDLAPLKFDEPNLEMYHRALSYSPTSMKGGARKTRMGGDNTNTVEKEGYADRPVPLLPDDTQKNLEKLDFAYPKRFDKHSMDDPEPETDEPKKGPTVQKDAKKVPEDAEMLKVVMDAYERFFTMSTYQLKSLDWNGNPWGPSQAKKMKQIIKVFDNLIKLDLSDTHLSFDGTVDICESLQGLDTVGEMIYLKMSNSRLCGRYEAIDPKSCRTDLFGPYERHGMVALTELLPFMPGLETLDISNNCIEQLEMKPFLDTFGGYAMPPDDSIKEEDLPPPPVVHQNKLKHLILSRNELGHVGAICLNRIMEKIPSLETVEVQLTRIHPDDMSMLKKTAAKMGVELIA